MQRSFTSYGVGLSSSLRERPSKAQAEEAVRTLIRWVGDDPHREGLRDTPCRVVRAYDEFFSGYNQDPSEVLSRTFEESGGYEGMVLLRDIRIESCCEHHMLPIVGRAHIGYLPDQRVVGISKLARVAGMYSRRLQIQEKLTTQIAQALEEALRPRGVAVVIEAVHHCMSLRGVYKPGMSMVTSHMLGVFREQLELRREFLSLIGHGSSVT